MNIIPLYEIFFVNYRRVSVLAVLVILLFCVVLVYLFVHGGVPQGVRARPTLPVTVGDHM